MADFYKYTPKLKQYEGGFVNHPADPGGATNRGVTLATFQAHFGSNRTVADLKKMTDAQWELIMKTYWDRCKGDQIRNQSIAELLVDWHINSGVAGIKAWQRSAALDADGIIGPKSLAVLNSPAEAVIFLRMKAAREQYYRNLALADPSKRTFLKGWLNRVNSFQYEQNS